MNQQEILKSAMRNSNPTRTMRRSLLDSTVFIDFDDLLPIIGEFGKFQKYMFFMTIPFMFIVAFVYLGQIFMTLVPQEFCCRVPDLNSLPISRQIELSIPKNKDGSYSQCLMYDANYTYLSITPNVTVNESLPKIPCKYGYSFNFTDIPYPTISTELGWVCDKDKYPTYAFMIFFLGSVCGGLIYGYLADNIGRIPALVSCNFLACIGGIVTSLSSNFFNFAFSRFIVGLAYDNCFTLMYILVLEYVGPSYRTLVGNMSIGLFYTPASCLVPWIALVIGNWRNFAIYTSLPIMLTVFIQCLIPESARWLVSVGKIDDAITILRNIAKWNKRLIDDEIFERFRISCNRYHFEEVRYRHNTAFRLFTSFRLLVVTILLIIIWGTMSLVYDGHVRAINTIGTDLFITFTVASATELPADILLVLIFDRIGRRWTSCFVMVASGAFSIWAAQLNDLMWIAVIAIAGRFFANICYNVGLQFAAEILPTVVRAQGLAFIHIIGYILTMLSPLIVYLAYITPALPLTILGILGIVGGLLSFLLPETLNQDLPQTLSEGEHFIKSSKFCSSPCCAKDPKSVRLNQRQHWHSGSSLRTTTGPEYRSKLLHRVVHSKPRQAAQSGKVEAQNVSGDEDGEYLQNSTVYKPR